MMCQNSWKQIPCDCSRIATGTLRCAEAVRPLRRCTKRTRSVRASPSRRNTTPWARTATRKSGPAAEPSLQITSSIRTTRCLRPTRVSTVCKSFILLSFAFFHSSKSLSLSLSLWPPASFDPALFQKKKGEGAFLDLPFDHVTGRKRRRK